MQGPRVHKRKTPAAPNENISKKPKEDLAQPAVLELTREINQKVRSSQYDSENASYKAGNLNNKLSETRKIIDGFSLRSLRPPSERHC